MKKFIFFICFIIIFSFTGMNIVLGNAARPTYVNRHYFQNGTYEIREKIIDGNIIWTEANSPYVIEDKVVIGSRGNLTIEAGVKVFFENTKEEFVVKDGGKLNIEGSFGNEVVFSKFSEGEDSWGAISFEKGSSGNIDFGKFEFGGSSSEAIINIYSSDVRITNTVFSNSSSSGICIVGEVDPIIKSIGFDLDNDYVILQKDVNADPKFENLFSHGKTGKIKIEAGANLGDSPCISRQINWEDPSLPYVIDGWLKIGSEGVLNIGPKVQVLFSELDTPLKGNITVSNKGKLITNDVEFNSEYNTQYWDYIYGEEGSELDIRNTTIENGGYSNKGALRIDTKDANIKNTTILNSSSHGIYIGKSDITPSLCGVVIEECNGYGIYLAENAKPKYDRIFQKDNEKDGVFVGSSQLYGNNVWGSDEGPYYLSGIYNLEKDANLDIGPGTIIYFEKNGELKKSSIIAKSGSKILSKGNSNNPIIYTGPSENYWGSIILENGSRGKFDYSIFEYGGHNDFYPLDSGSTNYGVLNTFTNNLVVHNSSFENLKNNGIYIGDGIAPYSISKNKFDIDYDKFAIYKWDKNINVYAGDNWWNHYSGPYNVNTNPRGFGPMVSDEINIFPFLESPFDNGENKALWKENPETSDIKKIWHIKFNYLIDPKYVNTSYINVLDARGEFIDIEVSSEGSNTIVVKPKNYYNKGKYVLIIKNGIKSKSGKTFKKGIEMKFDIM